MTLRLFVGNQRFSSWSLRPWICLVEAGLEFETVVLRFDDPTFKSKVPGTVGKVPVLVDGDLVVHESLAICEHVAELAPSAGLWPGDLRQRALARSFASEMHAGFASLRTECSMDVCRAEAKGAWPISAATRADVARIDAIFCACLASGGVGGPFLFGRFGVVDAMFAPVVSRILSYGLEVSPEARRYVDAVRALPSMQIWYEAGARELAAGWGHYGGGGKAPRDHEDAMAHALAWAEAWNRRDVEAVLAHVADDVVFVSPVAKELTGAARVEGKAALRDYWTRGAARMPEGLRFEVERVELDAEVGTLVIRYLRHEAQGIRRAAEVLEFDGRTGLVARGEAYYGA